MGLLLLILVVIAAIAAYLWYRQKMTAPAEVTSPSNRFHSVIIHSRANACEAVRAHVSTKFLAKEAPRLPLENCTVPNCQCSYKHYDDRRDEDRRETPDTTRYEGKQRRARKERRKESL